ncbi:Cochaperone protein [Friedmanniomyces endolithicus]|nr:Cochaperone protein [Friedmanniomyces endolithicus]KAK1825309.1 Cochaperone protein [Friedmanniomyces endolithicus]
MDQSALGKKALSESDYVDAIKHYTAALQQSPTSPAYLIQRATAYQRNKEYSRALNDANRAVLEARKRAKREQIVEAQFRRGVALYSLERYGDAEFVLKVVKRMDEKFKGLELWINKTKLTLSKLGSEDEGKGICKVGEVPEEGDDVPTEAATNAGATATEENAMGGTSTQQQPAPSTPAPPQQPQQTPADRIRHEWYQNNQNVYFTLLAKGVPSDQAQIDFTPRSLNISFPLATGASYDFTLEPLFAEIDPEACTKRVLSTKIEIGLAKKVHGKKWRALESDTLETEKPDSVTAADHDAVKAAILSHPAMSTGPVYPTSSKSGPKDWDKVTTDALRDPSAKPGTAAEDEDFEGGDESNIFFKKLFKGATPEVQRAMMKSYTESNGTALSTNWEEVSKGKVETSPPDGMQAREWDS